MINEDLRKQLIAISEVKTLMPSEEPYLLAMVGVPASGKTTFLSELSKTGALPPNHYYHNPDWVLMEIPQYHSDVLQFGAEKAKQNWEMATRTFADDILLPAALARRVNIVMDMGLCRPEILSMVRDCRRAGYIIDLKILHCDVAVAVERLSHRSIYVSPCVIRERAGFLSENLQSILNLADHTAAFDNSDLSNPFLPLSLKQLKDKVKNYSDSAVS